MVVLSFMPNAPLAARWNSQVGSGFVHGFDPSTDASTPGRAGPLYSEVFRFGRSVAGVWSGQSLSFYASQLAGGRELESSHGQDTHQLAGDMVVDATGRIALAYYSADNTDRPTVDLLLSTVTACGGAADASQPLEVALESSPPAPAVVIADHNDDPDDDRAQPWHEGRRFGRHSAWLAGAVLIVGVVLFSIVWRRLRGAP